MSLCLVHADDLQTNPKKNLADVVCEISFQKITTTIQVGLIITLLQAAKHLVTINSSYSVSERTDYTFATNSRQLTSCFIHIKT